MIRTDTVLRVEAMNILIRGLGEVDAERFISIVKSENFDYTEWRRGLWKGKSIEDIHKMAAMYEAANQ
jgi:hypothetical protein